MTWNIGAKNIAQKIRESSLDFAVSKPQVNKDKEIRNDVMRDLKKFISPEFINRIDRVIVFQQLAKEQVRSIIDNLTRNLRAVAKENGFELDITEAVSGEGLPDRARWFRPRVRRASDASHGADLPRRHAHRRHPAEAAINCGPCAENTKIKSFTKLFFDHVTKRTDTLPSQSCCNLSVTVKITKMMELFKTLALCCSALLLVLSISGCQVLPDSKAASHTTFQVRKPLAKDAALNDEEASQTTYEVSKPLVKDLTMNDEYVCQIRAIQHIEVRSLEKGYLQNVLVDEGESVRQGQLLFQIKPSVYEADVQKSEAEVELSKIELQNNQALVEKDIISATEAAMSGAKLAKVEAELALAKTHLGFTEIRAPFDGLIGRFGDIRLGSLLEENQLLTTLSDTHRVWVYFNVPEAQYLDYMEHKRLSQKVQLELANKEIYPETGKIEVIQSDFNSTSGNIAFRASFSNPKGLLRYGETGQILWPKKISQAVIVPQKSTYEILDKRFIFVVDKTGVIHEREIKVAREAPNVYIVASGIKPDEMFLLERQNKLDKGDKIRYKLIDPKDAIEKLNLYAE